MKAAATSLLVFVLAGCTAAEPFRPDIAARSVPSRLDEIAYVNGLREAFQYSAPSEADPCYVGRDLNHFTGSLAQGLPDHNIEQESGAADRCAKFKRLGSGDVASAIERYLDSGYGLTDLYCQRFFVIAVESDRKRQFQRALGGTGDTLVNAVLAASGASAVASQVSNAVFEGFDSTYQNIQDAFMVSPDLALVRKLVHEAQLEFKSGVAADPPVTYESARQVIERYAGTCSYTGMKQMVNDSVAAQTKALAAAAKATGVPPADGDGAAATPAEARPTPPEAAVSSPVMNPPG